MSKILHIKNWSEHYENNRTRDMKFMSWVPLPVNLNGNGYVALMEQKNGPAMFGVWCALLQMAASCAVRGVFLRGRDVPHTISSISTHLRVDHRLLTRTLDVLSCPDIDWVEWVESTTYKENPAGIPQASRSFTAVIPQEGAAKVRSPERNRTETPEQKESGVQNLRGSEQDQDPDPSPPPPSKKNPIAQMPKPGMSRVTRENIPPIPIPSSDPEQLAAAKVLADFCPKLGDPMHDPPLLRAIAGELARSGRTADDLAQMLRERRQSVRQADSWGLIITIVEVACRSRPLGPRKHPHGRILHPGDTGYDEAIPIPLAKPPPPLPC